MDALTATPGPPDPRGVVLMLHGGAEHGLREVDGRSASYRRTGWMYRSIRDELTASGLAVALLRFTVRGWNATPGRDPSPVPDARRALEHLRDQYAGVPIVLLGHSMGARTALHVADDASVLGMVGLAPWFPADEDVTPLAGRHLIAAHGRRDRITSARQTRRLVERARATAASAEFVDVGLAGHYMLTHVRRWNRVAIESTRTVLDRATDLDSCP